MTLHLMVLNAEVSITLLVIKYPPVLFILVSTKYCKWLYSLYPSIHPSIHPSTYLHVCLSILSIDRSIHPSIYLSIHPSIHLSICLYTIMLSSLLYVVLRFNHAFWDTHINCYSSKMLFRGRVSAHGWMGRRVDPSWVHPLSYFSFQ